ncbi:unnamed protein product [Alternaria alternata]
MARELSCVSYILASSKRRISVRPNREPVSRHSVSLHPGTDLMDRYLETSVREYEFARENSTSSQHGFMNSATNAAFQHTIETKLNLPGDRYTSFPPPSNSSLHRINSTHSIASTVNKTHTIEAEYAQYTDAPPPYTEKQYEGKSENEQNTMRSKDYAKEISRFMGHQLVRGLKSGETESK